MLDYKFIEKRWKVIKSFPNLDKPKMFGVWSYLKSNRLAHAQFRCLASGYENNADLIGVLNIFMAG
jgi:hypothetical protein